MLSQYFHDIGVFLHFQADKLLHKAIFLKPNWATRAVYKILDHDLLDRQQGRFDRQSAEEIWGEAEYRWVRAELLRLMEKFFLIYEIDRSGQYIAPERLPAASPKYAREEIDNLLLRYEYDLFMPQGILSQFIVQMHRYIVDHNLVWKRRVVLERENSKAEVTETFDARTIRIRIAGRHKRDF